MVSPVRSKTDPPRTTWSVVFTTVRGSAIGATTGVR
jgi:hypothetical protein